MANVRRSIAVLREMQLVKSAQIAESVKAKLIAALEAELLEVSTQPAQAAVPGVGGPVKAR